MKRLSDKEHSSKNKIEPNVFPRQSHPISRKMINPNALKVLYRLHEAGFRALLVGGCVRDLLLGRRPKDFDIATDARPDEVRKLFKNCRLIGKRFRLAHILFGRDIIEVATFRTHHQNASEQNAKSHKGMIMRDNVFGTIEDDVWRRDFTVNALYYDIADFSVVDFVNGMPDIQAKMLRIIGDPEKRYREDPVRLLRAIRFLGKLNLNISPETEEPIQRLSVLLEEVSSARIYQEVLKFFHEGALLETFKLLQKYHLLKQLFQQTAECLHQPEASKLIELALTRTDDRLNIGKTVSPAFLFAIFLWHPVRLEAIREENKGFPRYVAFEKAIQTVLKNQIIQLAIPRNLQVIIRDICFLQLRFTQRNGSRPIRVLEHPRFRAAYDMLLLRAESGEPVQELYHWWTQFSEADPAQRERLTKEINKTGSSKRRKKSKRSRRKSTLATDLPH